MKELTITHEVYDDFLGDILVTAFDGSYGGCWYWAEPAHDGWLHKDPDDTRTGTDKRWWKCEIVQQDDDDVEEYVVTYEVLMKGMKEILERDLIRRDLMEHLRTGIAEQDAGEIDSTLADCIVQVGLFGEVVYG